MQAEQGERRRQAEVAASETAGQAAIAAAAEAHDAATTAAQNRFNASIATLKAQLTASQGTAKALQATCTELETSRQCLASQCGELQEELEKLACQHRVCCAQRMKVQFFNEDALHEDSCSNIHAATTVGMGFLFTTTHFKYDWNLISC